MPAAVVDTGVLRHYFEGDARARQALAGHGHLGLSVVTWLELMALAPAGHQEATRVFLRRFERLSVSEAVTDEALRLLRDRPGLPQPRAISWACARVNRIDFITADARHLQLPERGVVLAYTAEAAEAAAG